MKKHLFKLLIIVFFQSFIISTFAQKAVRTSDIAPMPWMGGDNPAKSNNSYYYKVVIGEGSTLSDAQQKAVDKLISELSNEHGVNVSSVTTRDLRSDTYNGKENISDKFKVTTIIEGDGFKTAFKTIDKYWEQYSTNYPNKEFRCWVLFAVSKNPNNYSFDKVKFTTKYGASAIWRSAIVPGWGQLYKTEKAKGMKFLIGEGLLVSGIFVSEYFRKSYYNKALQTKDIDTRRKYNDYSNNFAISRNVFGVLAVAVYIYNIVDVITAKGARRYAYSKPSRLNFNANIDKEYYCLSVNFNF